MKKVHILFHDAGGGHRNAAVALQTVLAQQQRPWQVELIQFQELTDKLDVLRRLTGIRIQEQYNTLLQNGWTLGATTLLRILQATIRTFHGPMVRLLEDAWRKNPADMLISVIPHFNREIYESWNNVCPGRPFVTIITDLADFPPHFWIEPIKDQYVIAGTQRAVDQARAIGHDAAHIFPDLRHDPPPRLLRSRRLRPRRPSPRTRPQTRPHHRHSSSSAVTDPKSCTKSPSASTLPISPSSSSSSAAATNNSQPSFKRAQVAHARRRPRLHQRNP